MADDEASEIRRAINVNCIPEDLDEDDLRTVLSPYGRIEYILPWTSQNGNRHAFVTFERPEDATDILRSAEELARLPTPLKVEPVHKTLAIRYWNTKFPGKRQNKAMEVDATNHLLKRVFLSGALAASGKNGSPSGLNLGQSSLKVSPSRPRSSSQGESSPAQAAADPNLAAHARKAFLQKSMLSPAAQDVAALSLLEALPPDASGCQEHSCDHAKELRQLRALMRGQEHDRMEKMATLQEAYVTIKNFQAECASHLQRAENAERDALRHEDASRRYLGDLQREKGTHRRLEDGLKWDLNLAQDDNAKIRIELDRERVIREHLQAELGDCRQQIRELEETAQKHSKTIASPMQLSLKSNGQRYSDVEEGELSSTQTTAEIPAPSTPVSRSGMTLLPILEKAFLHLEEIIQPALRAYEQEGTQGNDGRGPAKRRRILDR